MRARMAIIIAQRHCYLREVLLRDKPPTLLAYSPKGTVPVVVLTDGTVIDESLDIMRWALDKHDPARWLHPENEDLPAMLSLIAACDGEFKRNLDRYKYATRYEGADPLEHRSKGEHFLANLDGRLQQTTHLFGERRCLADIAIAPFVRQFANADRTWFNSTPYHAVHRWLEQFLQSDLFKTCMTKQNQWLPDHPPVLFPPLQEDSP
jgi:glutathione S-transferase